MYEDKLKQYMRQHNIQAEHLSFNQSCHTVEEAAEAAGTETENIVKSICMIDPADRLIVAVVHGHDRASTKKVGNALEVSAPRLATPEEILERTGYPCGGTPPFGFQARFLIDPRVMEKDVVYAGGGSEQSLVKIPTAELQRANSGLIVRVRK